MCSFIWCNQNVFWLSEMNLYFFLLVLLVRLVWLCILCVWCMHACVCVCVCVLVSMLKYQYWLCSVFVIFTVYLLLHIYNASLHTLLVNKKRKIYVKILLRRDEEIYIWEGEITFTNGDVLEMLVLVQYCFLKLILW
jgi:hypothetical protein